MVLGFLALFIAVIPALAVAEWLRWWLGNWEYLLVQAVVLYFALSIRGLTEHGRVPEECRQGLVLQFLAQLALSPAPRLEALLLTSYHKILK